MYNYKATISANIKHLIRKDIKNNTYSRDRRYFRIWGRTSLTDLTYAAFYVQVDFFSVNF